MLCRTPIVALLAAAMTFAARGMDISVNVSVDSHIDSVTLEAGYQSGTITKDDGTFVWSRWVVGKKYTPTFAGISTGYLARWVVLTNGVVEALTGGMDDTITLPDSSFVDCKLLFYGEPKTYPITLNKQSGSGGSSSVIATYDVLMPPATMPTRAGYTFGGYFTETNGNGTQYYNVDGTGTRTWNIDEGRTLYAKWVSGTYDVTLNQQGGNGGTTSVSATYGEALQSSVTQPMREGFKFGGYFSEANGLGTKYYDQNGVAVVANSPFTSDTTIYAYWIRIWNVTFALNGASFKSGSGWTTTTNYEEGVGLTLPTGADMTYTSHTFNGWTELGSSGYVTVIGSSAIGDKNFIAWWSGETYNVRFEANDGSGRSGEQELSMVNTEWLKPVCELFAREGYSFAAWNKVADGSGGSYGDHAEISTANLLTNAPGAYVMLYAQWVPNPYKVAFNANGADGGTMTNQAFVYDVTQHLDAVEFTYTGHAFKDWSSDTNYNYQTKYYADGAEVVNLTALSNDVVNLYANWTGIVYTVSFDANGGAGAMEPMACTYNVSTNLPACVFTRDGWGFKNWTNAVGEAFVDRARVTNLTATAGADVALFACWTGVTYAVTLDARDSRGDGLMTNNVGEAVSMLTGLYTVGDVWNLPAPTNGNEHLSFDGWKYVDAQGTIHALLGAEVPPPSQGIANLVASWSWVPDALAIAVNAPELEFDTFGTAGALGLTKDSQYEAKWTVQSNFTCDNETAVQSGALNVPGEAEYDYYSTWLTTTVVGEGVLSFQWKCAARERYRVQDPFDSSNDIDSGDALRFGICNADGSFTEIARMEADRDWERVVYTNNTAEAVTFGWTFQFNRGGIDEETGKGLGGGTGWVDRVTWTPEGAAADVTPTHGVPYSWLCENLGASATATDEELEALAESASPNGKTWPDGTPVKVWEDYWAGTDPNDPNELFHALIAVTNGTPTITWRPDMREADPPRVYHVLCAPVPSARSEEWVDWPGPGTVGAATNRFFKVELDVEGSR